VGCLIILLLVVVGVVAEVVAVLLRSGAGGFVALVLLCVVVLMTVVITVVVVLVKATFCVAWNTVKISAFHTFEEDRYITWWVSGQAYYEFVGFSHWCCCGFQFSGMWWHVNGPVVSDVSMFSNVVCSFRTPGPLKITAQHPFKRSGTTFPVMQNHIPKSHNPHY